MDLVAGTAEQDAEIVGLFRATFTASEGAQEGRVIGALVHDLLATTAADDLHVHCAREGAALVGCILFSRLRYAGDPRPVFLLAPVAVATAHQGKGIGQKLIDFGLAQIRALGGAVALTYGDPAFYGRVGFAPIAEKAVPAPFALTEPGGWLGQSLTGRPLETLAGPARCVAAFDDPAFW